MIGSGRLLTDKEWTEETFNRMCETMPEYLAEVANLILDFFIIEELQ